MPLGFSYLLQRASTSINDKQKLQSCCHGILLANPVQGIKFEERKAGRKRTHGYRQNIKHNSHIHVDVQIH